MLPVQACTSRTSPISPDHRISQAVFGALMVEPLVAHLGRDLIFRRGVGQQVRFPRGARQGLFAVDVLAVLHAQQRDGGVQVIGSGDHHRVDVLALLVEHLAEVFVLLCLGYSVKHGAALTSSTSQSATMFSVAAAPARICGPRVPTPMAAIFSFSLNDLYPNAGSEGVLPNPPEGTAPASSDP